MSWSNGNPRVSHISSLVTCNSHVSANLMVGSDDGCVRVWALESEDARGHVSEAARGHVSEPPRASQVTGWLVMPELVPQSLSSGSRVSCGLQMAWDQQSMTLMAGGDYKVRPEDHVTSAPIKNQSILFFQESSDLGLFK